MKELFVDLLISSNVTMKLKNKFQIVKSLSGIEVSEQMSSVYFVLLKAA